MYAAHYDRLEVVQFLWRKGAKIDAKNKNGKNAQEMAEASGNKKIVEFLKKVKKCMSYR